MKRKLVLEMFCPHLALKHKCASILWMKPPTMNKYSASLLGTAKLKGTSHSMYAIHKSTTKSPIVKRRLEVCLSVKIWKMKPNDSDLWCPEAWNICCKSKGKSVDGLPSVVHQESPCQAPFCTVFSTFHVCIHTARTVVKATITSGAIRVSTQQSLLSKPITSGIFCVSTQQRVLFLLLLAVIVWYLAGSATYPLAQLHLITPWSQDLFIHMVSQLSPPYFRCTELFKHTVLPGTHLLLGQEDACVGQVPCEHNVGA